LLLALSDLSHRLPIVFPIHPRTRQRIDDLGLRALADERMRLLDPQPYLAFLALQQKARFIITDSGGMQEESSYLGVPCLTVRENTERPITVTLGTNVLIGRDLSKVKSEAEKILSARPKAAATIPLWDGRAAERVAAVIVNTLN